jgi:hypothetical protein
VWGGLWQNIPSPGRGPVAGDHPAQSRQCHRVPFWQKVPSPGRSPGAGDHPAVPYWNRACPPCLARPRQTQSKCHVQAHYPKGPRPSRLLPDHFVRSSGSRNALTVWKSRARRSEASVYVVHLTSSSLPGPCTLGIRSRRCRTPDLAWPQRPPEQFCVVDCWRENTCPSRVSELLYPGRHSVNQCVFT